MLKPTKLHDGEKGLHEIRVDSSPESHIWVHLNTSEARCILVVGQCSVLDMSH